MFCSECGAQITEEANFCYNCGTKVIKPAKKVPKEFIYFVKDKYIDRYTDGEEISPDLFFKKATFYEVEPEQVKTVVAACEEKIKKLESYIDSMYEECPLFELDEDDEDEIFNFGNSLGLDDEDIEDLMEHHNEVHHIEDMQELYSKCVAGYIKTGRTHFDPDADTKDYEKKVYDVFEKNILFMESFLKNEYEKTSNDNLSQDQIDSAYAEGEKLFPEGTIAGIIYQYDKKSDILKRKEEKQQKKELANMTHFDLYGERLGYTEREVEGIRIGVNYRVVYESVYRQFLTCYQEDCTKDGYWDELNRQIVESVGLIYQTTIGFLRSRQVSDEDLSSVSNIAFYQYWLPIFDQVDDKYNRICLGNEEAAYYRKIRKENRGRFEGGGFGINGAIKGIATAGVFNLASGAAHSAFNFVGDVKNSLKMVNELKDLFGYSLKSSITQMFQNTVQFAYATELGIIGRYGISAKAFHLFYAGREGSEETAKIDSLKENPFDANCYENLIRERGLDTGMDALAGLTQIDIEKAKADYIENEREARKEDGIVFPTMDDKQMYCGERDVYVPLLDELEQMNVWIDGQEFDKKVSQLKAMEPPAFHSFMARRDRILTRCEIAQKETNTPNKIYLSKVLSIAKNESWMKTIVREGHSNFHTLLDYYNSKFHFDEDERFVLFITNNSEQPSHGILFGTKHIYKADENQRLQFDYHPSNYTALLSSDYSEAILQPDNLTVT